MPGAAGVVGARRAVRGARDRGRARLALLRARQPSGGDQLRRGAGDGRAAGGAVARGDVLRAGGVRGVARPARELAGLRPLGGGAQHPGEDRRGNRRGCARGRAPAQHRRGFHVCRRRRPDRDRGRTAAG